MPPSELRLRIIVTDPPIGVMVSLQDKHSRPVEARLSNGAEVSFDVPVRASMVRRPGDAIQASSFELLPVNATST